VPIWQIAGEVALFLAIWFVWKKRRWKRDTKSGNIERASTADSSVLFANYEAPSKLVPDTEAALKGIGIVVAWTVLVWLGLVHGTWMTTPMGTDINVTEVMTDLTSAVVFTVVLVLIFRILINALLKRMPLP